MRRQRDHAIATPPSLIARLAKAAARAEVFWVEARKANDFKLFAPHLEEVVTLVRDKAALLGSGPRPRALRCPGRCLHSGYLDRGYRHDLQGLVAQAPGAHQSGDRSAGRPARRIPLTGKFSAARQRQLSLEVLKALGFPFDRGRLDESEHPFTEGVPGDIRVTTRFDPSDPFHRAAWARFTRPATPCTTSDCREVARSAGRPRPRPGARGEPVAAVRDESVPQPRVRGVPEAAHGQVPAGERAMSGASRTCTGS